MKKIKEFNKLMSKINKYPESGLRDFYKLYAKLIVVAARNICRLPNLVDEVLNNVLIKVWQHSDVMITSNPEGWIYKLTVNCAKDVLKQKEFTPLVEDIGQESVEIENLLATDVFYSYIKDLNQTEQQIMILKFVSNLTFNEIAHEMNVPPSSVSGTYYRALSKIKEQIKLE